MTRQDFILTTLEGYFKDPSTCGYEDGRCVYRAENGNKCAFGQHIREDAYHPGMEGCLSSSLFDSGDNILTPEAQAQNLTPAQWNSIQRVHDNLARLNNGATADLPYVIEGCEAICDVDLSQLKTYLV